MGINTELGGLVAYIRDGVAVPTERMIGSLASYAILRTQYPVLKGRSIVIALNTKTLKGYSIVVNPMTKTLKGYSIAVNPMTKTLKGYSKVATASTKVLKAYTRLRGDPKLSRPLKGYTNTLEINKKVLKAYSKISEVRNSFSLKCSSRVISGVRTKVLKGYSFVADTAYMQGTIRNPCRNFLEIYDIKSVK